MMEISGEESLDRDPPFLRAALTIGPPGVNECAGKFDNKTILDVTCREPGYAIEMLQQIQPFLDRQIRLSFYPGNDSWDLIRSALATDQADMSVEMFTQTSARHRHVDFAAPVIFYKTVFVVSANLPLSPRMDFFISPLHHSAWAAVIVGIFAVFLVAALMNVALKRLRPGLIPGSVGRMAWKMWSSIVGKETDDYYHVHGPEKPLMFTWTFFIMLIQSLYTSMLVASFVTQSGVPFQTINQLATLLHRGDLQYIARSTNKHFLVQVRSIDTPEHLMIREAFKRFPPIIEPNVTRLWERLMESSNYVADENSFAVGAMFKDNCRVKIVEVAAEIESWCSFILPKNSSKVEPLSAAIYWAKAFIAKIQNRYELSPCHTETVLRSYLHLDHILGLMSAWLGVCLIGAIVCLLEVFASRAAMYLKTFTALRRPRGG